MIPGSLPIEWNDLSLELHPQRAVHWPARSTLIIADAHFGKAAAFRHHGVPVPEGTTQADLDRLTALLVRTRAERLVILGDFFHARAGRDDATMLALSQWRLGHAELEMLMVRGNHDLHAGDPPSEWNIQCHPECFPLDGMTIAHHPDHSSLISATPPALCGHVHPCVVLRDRDGSSFRATVFHFGPRIAILPAFGSFTGTHPISPRRGDRVFAIGPDQVVEVHARRPAATVR